MKLNTFFQSIPQKKIIKIPRVIFFFESHDAKASPLTLLENLDFLKANDIKSFSYENYRNTTPALFYARYKNEIKPLLEAVMQNPMGHTQQGKLLIDAIQEHVPWYRPGYGHEEAISILFESFRKISEDSEFTIFSYDTAREPEPSNLEAIMAQGISRAVDEYNDVVVKVGAFHASKILAELKKLQPEVLCINFFFLRRKYLYRKDSIDLPDDAYIVVDDGRFSQAEINEFFQKVIIQASNKKKFDARLAKNYQAIINAYRFTFYNRNAHPSLEGAIKRDKEINDIKIAIIDEIQWLLLQDNLFVSQSSLKAQLKNFLSALLSIDYMPWRYATLESNAELSKDELRMFAVLKRELLNNKGIEFASLKELLRDFQQVVNISAYMIFEDCSINPQSNRIK